MPAPGKAVQSNPEIEELRAQMKAAGITVALNQHTIPIVRKMLAKAAARCE